MPLFAWLTAVLLSSVAMAIDSPHIDPDSTLATALHGLDIGFTALFGVEMLLKSFL